VAVVGLISGYGRRCTLLGGMENTTPAAGVGGGCAIIAAGIALLPGESRSTNQQSAERSSRRGHRAGSKCYPRPRVAHTSTPIVSTFATMASNLVRVSALNLLPSDRAAASMKQTAKLFYQGGITHVVGPFSYGRAGTIGLWRGSVALVYGVDGIVGIGLVEIQTVNQLGTC